MLTLEKLLSNTLHKVTKKTYGQPYPDVANTIPVKKSECLFQSKVGKMLLWEIMATVKHQGGSVVHNKKCTIYTPILHILHHSLRVYPTSSIYWADIILSSPHKNIQYSLFVLMVTIKHQQLCIQKTTKLDLSIRKERGWSRVICLQEFLVNSLRLFFLYLCLHNIIIT